MAVLPPLVAYGTAVVLAGVVTALASGVGAGTAPDLARALAAGVPLWLAAHLVPLQLGGVPLGLLPLAPALGVAVLVARTARTAARRLGGTPTVAGAPVVATAAAAHAVVGVLAAALLAPETVVDASPATAGVVAGLLACAAALAGVAGPCGAPAELRRLPGWTRHGLRTGLLAAALLLCAGTALLLAALVADAPAVAAILEATTPEAGSGAGLALLSVLYLPNAVVAAASWLAGPGLTLGVAVASPTAAVPLPAEGRPPVPLLALLPEGPPPSWAVLVFAVPMVVGSGVGWRLATSSSDPSRRLRSVLVAGLVAGSVLGLLAALAGGRVGQGPVDPVVVPAAALAAAVLAWVVVPGAAVAVLASPPASSSTGASARTSAGPGRPRRSGHPNRARDRTGGAAAVDGAGDGGADGGATDGRGADGGATDGRAADGGDPEETAATSSEVGTPSRGEPD